MSRHSYLSSRPAFSRWTLIGAGALLAFAGLTFASLAFASPAGAQPQPQADASTSGATAPTTSTLPAAGASRTAHWNMRKWVDKDGGVHYGDAAAAPSHAVRVTISGIADPRSDAAAPLAPSAVASSDSDSAPPTPIVMPDVSSWPKDAQGNRIAPNAEAACSVARANKQALADTSRPALAHDEKGAAYLMTDDQRAAAAAKADQDIGSFCTH
jgi:hypothetical protein